MDKKIDPFAIVVGGTYLTRGGNVVGPIRAAKKGEAEGASFAFDLIDGRGTFYWNENGLVWLRMGSHPLDLVEQIKPAPEKVTYAFPCSDLGVHGTFGMTLRQYYAGHFMAALIGSSSKDNLEKIAISALNCADALIALEKESH